MTLFLPVCVCSKFSCNPGLPEDIVSDWDPQFASWFWKEFCRLPKALVSLCSRLHLETNGQMESNQEMKMAPSCITSQNPFSSQLPSCCIHWPLSIPAYQFPIFPALEEEVVVPLAHAVVRDCHLTWRKDWEALF